ncbi:MAG TPA: rhomboid family intramembrane serine protease, partial [Solirubrobacteraceae bacterium]|nr:rhomboid family intramembrane serine protease [Solirubrobacteraceae bacterium]
MIPLKDNIPLSRFPFVTVVLVAINVIVYLLSIRHGGSFFNGPSTETVVHNAAIPYDFTHPGKYCTLFEVRGESELGPVTVGTESKCEAHPFPGQLKTWETAFAAMFLHGNILHIAGNMLFLAIFGPNVEDAMGRARYVAFYLLGGLVALAAQVGVQPNSMAPTLGASGAIAGVMGMYLIWFPKNQVRVLALRTLTWMPA